MSEIATLDGMAKKPFKTVPVHTRLPESDVAVLDKLAAEEFVSRSTLITRIVREWIKQRQSPKQSKR